VFALPDLLQILQQSHIQDLALASGRPLMGKVDGAYQPLAQDLLVTADIVSVVEVALGQRVKLSANRADWTVPVGRLGSLEIAAAQRGDVVQVRLRLHGAPVASSGAAAPAPAPARPAPSSPPRAPAAAPAPAPMPVAPRPVASSNAAGVSSDLLVLLMDARAKNASDLHVVADRPPLMRVARELKPVGETLDAALVEAMLLPIIPDNRRAGFERDGACDFALHHLEAGRFRVNVSRQRTGLKGTLRVIPHEAPTLASLGLPESLATALHHHQGLIVLTGPSGHGKTSTLAALVDRINEETKHHVITVEDPIEYIHPNKQAVMSQREVGSHTKTFQTALKGSLRQDPEVIVVGELRDTETVRMALSASETGHLLLATMNTPSAAKTIDRLIDLFPPEDQQQVRLSLSVGLRMIVSQRLIPTPDRTGVVAAAEILPGSISLGNLIRENKTYQIPSLQQRGKSMGVVRLDDSLAELVHQERVNLEDAQEYADNPDEIATMVKQLRTPQEPAMPPGSPPPPRPQQPPAPGDKRGGMLGGLMGRRG
jgi:twitching motility protein PilT